MSAVASEPLPGARGRPPSSLAGWVMLAGVAVVLLLAPLIFTTTGSARS